MSFGNVTVSLTSSANEQSHLFLLGSQDKGYDILTSET